MTRKASHARQGCGMFRRRLYSRRKLSRQGKKDLNRATVVVKLPVNADRHGDIGICMFAMMPGPVCSFAVCNTWDLERSKRRRNIKESLFSAFFFEGFEMRNDRKNEMVHFRCSESEKKVIEDAAESIGLGKSLFLRTSILKAAKELGHGRDQRQKSGTVPNPGR